MNSSKFRLTLDLHSVQSQYSIPVMVEDTNVTLLISITDGGIPYKIPDGCLAKLSIKRPKGSHLVEFCKVKNNAVIEYPFSQNKDTCAEEGIHHCDVTLYSPDGEKVGGPRFTMVVSEMVVRRDDIELSEDDHTLVKAIEKVEAARQYAEFLREKAEDDRVQAEANRVDAEIKRGNITEYALQAEESASRAEKAALSVEGHGEKIILNDKRITNLEKGYSDDLFTTDAENATTKVVPYNALPYAEVKKVYGNIGYANGTYFLKNPMRVESCKIFEKEIVDVTLDLSEMGDTMSVNKFADGSIAFTGTTNGWYRFATITVPKGKWKMSIRENGGAFAHDFIISDRPNGTSIDGRVEQAAEDKTIDLYVFTDACNEYTVFIEMLNENSAISIIEIPEKIRNIPDYGCTPDNYLDLENKQLFIKRRLVDNKITFVDPPEIIDVSQYLGDDNLIEVVPNGYIRVIQETGEEMACKTEVEFMLKGV